MSDDKTFAATAQRRRRARESGHVPRGRDLTGIAVILAGTGALLCCGPWWFRSLGESWSQMFADTPAITTNPAHAIDLIRLGLSLVAKSVLPAMGLFFAVALVTQWAQVGTLWLPERVVPDFNRVNPFNRAMGGSGLVKWGEGGWVILRYLIGLAVGVFSLWLLRDSIGPGPEQANLMFGRAAQTGVAIIFHAAVGLAVVSIVEYGYRWWRHESELMMTAHEAREEMREQEGDLRVRSLQRGAYQNLHRRSADTSGDAAE